MLMILLFDFDFLEKIVEHVCAIFNKLFQRSVTSPYITLIEERTLEPRARTTYFTSECTCYLIERFIFYMDHPHLLLPFLRLIERISGYTSIADMLVEQNVLVLIVKSMKEHDGDARVQLSALKIIDNLGSTSIQGLCWNTFFFCYFRTNIDAVIACGVYPFYAFPQTEWWKMD